MTSSVYDLRAFYGCRKGCIIQPVLQERILALWPDMAGLRVMGCGYAVPYLAPCLEGGGHVLAMMPRRFGVHAWEGSDGQNRAFLADDLELPIETESVDRILLVHSLEHSESPGPYLQELWRVLKSTGRIMIVVPNRMGLWARAEWSPFGHGTPFSAMQLSSILRENLFVVERHDRVLCIPPFRSSVLLRAFLPLETFGRRFFGGLAGVLIVEASKQLYSGTLAQQSARIRLQTRRVFVPNPAPGG